MKKIIFFLRHNNDVDHITPILYKWITTKNIATDIIITSQRKLLKDYRIEYLKEISKNRSDVKIYHITDLFTTKQKWYYKLFQLYTKYYTVKQFTTIDKTMEQLVESFMEKYFINWSNCVVCFDWSSDYFTKLICANAKSKCFITVALPHGDEPYYNKIQRDEDINYAQAVTPYLDRQFFDYILVPNKLCANHYKNVDDQIHIFGSPRYCDEWLEIHNTIKPKKVEKIVWSNEPPKVLKVLLFLRNQHFPLNWNEVVNAIKLITQFKELYLIVKNHPRGAYTYDLLNCNSELMDIKNLEVISDDTNSSALIDWADLVLDVGTSIAWEPIKQNKPTLMLEYLQSNVTVVGHYIKKTILRSRDDLLNELRKFYKNKQRAWCKERHRQKFLKDVIGDDGKVLEHYTNFLEGLLND